MKGKASLIFIGAALLALVACSDDTETRLAAVPTVTLSPSSVTLSAEAVESYTINYTVSNPAEGASVSASADVSWLSGIDYSVSGQVRFSVEANASDEMRTGALTLTYSYDDGTVTAKAAVVQYGAGDPVLSVDPNAVVASHEGGVCSFGYSIENPIDGESVSCSADADWVSGFDYSEYGKVSFTVAESEEEELRTATITVSYASLSKEVTVVQDHLGSGNDSGSGGGSLVGTYKAGGYAYAGVGVDAYTTWTLKIYEYDGSCKIFPATYTGDFDYYIDGLVPNYTGQYDYYGDHRVSAAAYIDGSGNLIVPTQVLNAQTTDKYGDTYYLGYTPCTSFGSDGWGRNYDEWPDLTFTYNESNGCWEADYGVFLGAFTTTSLTMGGYSELATFFDVVSPGIFQFTKDGNLGGGDGGDGGDFDHPELIGTYNASGDTYYSQGVAAHKEWTLRIFEYSSTQVIIDGLVPACEDYYASGYSEAYVAKASMNSSGQIVISAQFTGYRSSSGYIGWTPCTGYDEGNGWHYNPTGGDCTLTYDSSTGIWTSDYGMFLGLFSTYDNISTFNGFYDVSNPGFTITKVSDDPKYGLTSVNQTSSKTLDNAPVHTDVRVEPSSATSTGLMTRRLESARNVVTPIAR